MALYVHLETLFFQGMTELPDYNKITFPEMPPIPLEKVVPDATKEVGQGRKKLEMVINVFYNTITLFHYFRHWNC